MPVQPQLFSGPGPVPPGPRIAPPAAEVAPIWLQRMSLLMLVLFCVYLGALMAILPWWSAVWEHNPLFQEYPRVWAVLKLGMVRGVISGLGLLDIWIGISEAIHYREDRP